MNKPKKKLKKHKEEIKLVIFNKFQENLIQNKIRQDIIKIINKVKVSHKNLAKDITQSKIKKYAYKWRISKSKLKILSKIL